MLNRAPGFGFSVFKGLRRFAAEAFHFYCLIAAGEYELYLFSHILYTLSRALHRHFFQRNPQHNVSFRFLLNIWELLFKEKKITSTLINSIYVTINKRLLFFLYKLLPQSEFFGSSKLRSGRRCGSCNDHWMFFS